MTLEQRRHQVQMAVARASCEQNALQGHLAAFRESRRALLQPHRVVTLGLVSGFVSERLGSRSRRVDWQSNLDKAIHVVAHLIPQIGSAVAVLMPVWISLRADTGPDRSPEPRASETTDSSPRA